MFSREVPVAPEVRLSESILPVRGSDHPAFIEMLFLWGETLEEDPRFRKVVLPSGFSFVSVNDGRSEIRDLGGNIRAAILVPPDGRRIPAISPVRRFSFASERIDSKYRGVVYDRGDAFYRTKPLATERDAVDAAKKWLDVNKPRWDSYTSAVNFDPHP